MKPCDTAEVMKAAELLEFRTLLLAWFAKHKRELPWRADADAYRIWVSEIMLQQTRVAAVIPYYERFLERFPSIAALAEAPEEEVLRYWSGLGYYSRARNLQRAAQEIVARHEGIFPASAKDVLALPGIGAYTAGAIGSIAFGQKMAVLDGNVARVIARLFAVRGDLRTGDRWRGLQVRADGLLDGHAPGDWNQAMMELGATVCTPRAPQCLLCPAGQFCEARKQGSQEEIPKKRVTRATEPVTLAAAVFLDARGKTLLLPPPARGAEEITAAHVPALVSRMWHFPTMAVKKNAERELKKYLEGLGAGLGAHAGERWSQCMKRCLLVRHAVTYRAITVHPYCVRMAKLPSLPGSKKVALEQLSSLAISNLTRKIAQAALAEHAAGAAEKTSARRKRAAPKTAALW
jgi:A/G-specific adenine glycosylase